MTEHPIYLMARNDLPEVASCGCGKPGAWLCMDYDDNPDEVVILCKEHAQEKEYQDHVMMPIVNSPRTGRCGYEGPAEPPY
ncbi:MAG: hypothetical protein D3909_01595 [Candidatus Electrothrix sp. ATG1]|nr:hypothetical protein [Candidatus Electrothrix sp. ATG1]